jgi:hypothetical protein
MLTKELPQRILEIMRIAIAEFELPLAARAGMVILVTELPRD